MSWQEELDQILSKLNVQQDTTNEEEDLDQILSKFNEQSATDKEEEFSITQLSLSRPGVSYRLDIPTTTPELRVYIPTNEGMYKMEIYLVRLSPQHFLSHFFGFLMAHEEASPAFQEIEGPFIYHVLLMMLKVMEELFWQGDVEKFQFPSDIDVRRLL
jgi:hypothetical protein